MPVVYQWPGLPQVSVLLRQNTSFFRDRSMLALSRQNTSFVATNTCLSRQKWYSWQLPPMPVVYTAAMMTTGKQKQTTVWTEKQNQDSFSTDSNRKMRQEKKDVWHTDTTRQGRKQAASPPRREEKRAPCPGRCLRTVLTSGGCFPQHYPRWTECSPCRPHCWRAGGTWRGSFCPQGSRSPPPRRCPLWCCKTTHPPVGADPANMGIVINWHQTWEVLLSSAEVRGARAYCLSNIRQT